MNGFGLNLRNIGLTVALGLLTTSAVLAHGAQSRDKVKNPAVLERMDNMSAIAQQMKILSDQAKGSTPFNNEAAQAALDALLPLAQEVPKLFKAEERDPESEISERAWQDWQGFLEANAQFEQALAQADVSDLAGVQRSLSALGQSCKACHRAYRK